MKSTNRITSSPVWTPEQDQELRRLIGEGYNRVAAGEVLGRTESAIRYRMSYLRLVLSPTARRKRGAGSEAVKAALRIVGPRLGRWREPDPVAHQQAFHELFGNFPDIRATPGVGGAV